MEQNFEKRPTRVIPYWGGNVSVWLNGDEMDLSVRSQFHSDQFDDMIRTLAARLGGNGPSKKQYWWFRPHVKESVVAALEAWAAGTGKEGVVATFMLLEA